MYSTHPPFTHKNEKKKKTYSARKVLSRQGHIQHDFPVRKRKSSTNRNAYGKTINILIQYPSDYRNYIAVYNGDASRLMFSIEHHKIYTKQSDIGGKEMYGSLETIHLLWPPVQCPLAPISIVFIMLIYVFMFLLVFQMARKNGSHSSMVVLNFCGGWMLNMQVHKIFTVDFYVHLLD